MRNRTEEILRLACLIVAALVLMQFIHGIFHVSSFFGVHIPGVPTLETNSIAGSNPASAPQARAVTVVNSPTASIAIITTGSATDVSTNLAATKSAGTNLVSTHLTSNTLATANHTSTNEASTNAALAKMAVTNPVPISQSKGSGTNLNFAGITNSPPKTSRHALPPILMAGGMGFGGMPGMPGNLPALPPEIQARIDKIVASGFLAPVMHPLPMGLLGIAGDTAFLRTDSGQTGLVKEGDSLGDVKLLRIGINRVLVERAGQQEELTIFDGYGGDSLLSQKDKSSK